MHLARTILGGAHLFCVKKNTSAFKQYTLIHLKTALKPILCRKTDYGVEKNLMSDEFSKSCGISMNQSLISHLTFHQMLSLAIRVIFDTLATKLATRIQIPLILTLFKQKTTDCNSTEYRYSDVFNTGSGCTTQSNYYDINTGDTSATCLAHNATGESKANIQRQPYNTYTEQLQYPPVAIFLPLGTRGEGDRTHPHVPRTDEFATRNFFGFSDFSGLKKLPNQKIVHLQIFTLLPLFRNIRFFKKRHPPPFFSNFNFYFPLVA